jgi:hypothetical protein
MDFAEHLGPSAMLHRVTNNRFLALLAAMLGLLIIAMSWGSTYAPLRTPASPTTAEEALWRWFDPELPLRVKAFKVLDWSKPDRAQFRVVISAEPDASLPYGWRAGDNIRWVTLQHTAGGWVTADVAVHAGA